LSSSAPFRFSERIRSCLRLNFNPVLSQQGFDAGKAKVRLNWGSPETPEIKAADLIAAATANPPLIRSEEFRKNAVKILGWELWDEKSQQPSSSAS
jgi:hypothetical protein